MDPVACQILVLCAVATGAVYHAGTAPALLAYALAWAFFHGCEYYATCAYLPRTASPYSFLMYGATGLTHLMAVHLASVLEHIYASRDGHRRAGMAVAGAGVLLRTAAIRTCGDSFSHYLETGGHTVLVTHGVYRLCRHPSYLGFLVYVCGMQAILGNVVMLAVSMGILGWFFVRRIRVEEWFLANRMFPATYAQYQREVWALLPGLY